MTPNRPQELVLIAAVAQNGVIGVDNRLPWRLPEDLRYFKAQTSGHSIIMGRKTFDSLGQPLPNRRHIVVTRNPDWRAEGVEAVHSLEAALAACTGEARAFVIGGAELYRQALPLADVLLLTEVALSPAGDAHFPALDRTVWRESRREAGVSADGLAYAFVEYRR